MYGEAHQRVAVGGSEVGALQQLLEGEAVELRRHFGAAAEDAGDSRLLERDLLAEGFEQFRRGEHAADTVVGAQQGEGLFDDVLFVGFGFVDLAALDQLDDPARVEVGHEADPAAMLGEMLDRQSEAAGTAGADHDPVGAAGECVVGQLVAEGFVVDAEVVDTDARFGDAGAAAGFEDADGRLA